MARPSKEQVQQEIVTLREQLTTVRRFSFFGDDNKAMIQAQIYVAVDDMDDDAIRGMFAASVEDAAYQMREWLDGEVADESPSDVWAPLCE